MRTILSRIKRKLLRRDVLTRDNHHLIAASGQFDAEYYREQLLRRRIAIGSLDPIAHYLVKGAKMGLDPSPSFSSKAYIDDFGLGPSANPLLHFIRHTQIRLKRDPDFDPVYYMSTNPDVARAYIDAAWHFLSAGCREGRSPSALLDAERLCEKLGWRIHLGGSMGSPPNDATPQALIQAFDAEYYLNSYPDIRNSGLSPLEHYLLHGWSEGRNPAPWFNTKAYLMAYPDVRTAGIEPFGHYVTIGEQEGRKAFKNE